MSWLYQPFPLAAPVDAAVEEDEALTGEASTVSAGSLVSADRTVALLGAASTCSAGLMDLGDTGEEIAGIAVTTSAGTIAPLNNSVRLRSRKTGGSSTAENVLQGQFSLIQQGTVLNNVSKLLGGSGITMSQQSFPTKVKACLLVGQSRTMGMTAPTASGSVGSGLPAWVQQPTQVDEENYYNTAFAPGSGKEEQWIFTSSDKTVTFANPINVNLLRTGHRIHDDTEGDDLWTHYNQYKRTSLPVHLSWSQGWRDFFVDDYAPNMVATGGTGGDVVFGTSCNNYDHLYGQGLVMWAMEQNDSAARQAALLIAATVEPSTLALGPIGTLGVSGTGFSPSNGESRRYARRLLFLNYIVMLEPIARWIDLRDHMLELWINNPGWVDTTNVASPTIVGGTHQAGIGASSLGWSATQYTTQGFRYDHSFMYGLKNEAFWLSYKLTGRTEIAEQLIEMQRYIMHYAWDPLHPNPMCGGRWGHRPLSGPGSETRLARNTPGYLHLFSDEYTGSSPGVPLTAVDLPMNMDPNETPTDNYEASLVNGLVYAYKLTGETAFLKRAREHFRQATQYTGATGTQTKQPSNQVNFFIDTKIVGPSGSDYFNFNKGQLQYAGRIFENGGIPTLEPIANPGWTPPYQVPVADGQVVKIAGGTSSTNPYPSILTQSWQTTNGIPDATPSTFPTNVFEDVGPVEIGDRRNCNSMLTGGDTRSKFITSYSEGGAVVIAGSGGHNGTPVFGAALFDFADARWKHVWTTQGNPGVDNVSQDYVDIAAGRRVHNCLNHERDLTVWYSHSGTECYNPDHWVPGAGFSTQTMLDCPFTADPRDQTHETSTRFVDAEGRAAAGHKWSDNTQGFTEAEFGGEGGMGHQGYMAASTRFDPTPPGTLSPEQSGLPSPAHIWDQYYEILPEEGGGPRGSIATGKHQNIGTNGVISNYYSHKFDLYTGIWSRSTVNSGYGSNSNPPGGDPVNMASAVAGAEDPVARRGFLIGKEVGNANFRVNYFNMSDMTWRNFTVGSPNITPQSTLTENMWVDWDRRLLLICSPDAPYLHAFDMQTLGQTGTPEPTPSHGTGGWRPIPFDDIPGVQSYPPWVGGSGAIPNHNGAHNNNVLWRYYPPNGKYYRVNTRSGRPGATIPRPTVPVLQRLTPPPIIATPRPNYYYTTEALSGRWTLDEISLSMSLPAPAESVTHAFCGFSYFHYVPALQLMAYLPLNSGSGGPSGLRRCVYLIKPY